MMYLFCHSHCIRVIRGASTRLSLTAPPVRPLPHDRTVVSSFLHACSPDVSGGHMTTILYRYIVYSLESEVSNCVIQ